MKVITTTEPIYKYSLKYKFDQKYQNIWLKGIAKKDTNHKIQRSQTIYFSVASTVILRRLEALKRSRVIYFRLKVN